LFFGGWHYGTTIDGFIAAHTPNIWFIPKSLVFSLITLVMWSVKIVLFCMFQLMIRWSLPRFRSDQLMRLGWQRLLPISIANVLVTALPILLLYSRNHLE